MGEVIPFDPTPRRNLEEALNERVRREQESGGSAWARLKKCRKLKIDDRNALAKAMHKILQDVKQSRPDITSLQLAERAGFPDSKELYRLTLPYGADPVMRKVRTDPKKFIRLLEAIQKLNGENLSLLADRLLHASSFHPKRNPGSEESEKIISLLQEAIKRIDQGFREINGGDTLLDAFMKTARRKVELAKDRCYLYWPYADYWGEIIRDHGVDGIDKGSPLQPIPEDELDPLFTYWKRNYAAGVSWNNSPLPVYVSWVGHHDALMKLPRIHLGAAEWETFLFNYQPPDGVSLDEHKRTQIIRVQAHAGKIGEVRDPRTGDASIAHLHPKTGEWMPGTDGTYENEYVSVDGCDDVWLVIYPSPDNRTLIPVLYHPCEEGGTLLTPLTERGLIALKDLTFVDDGEPRSMYVRIKELMGYGSGEFTIFNQWEATAIDILRNPILLAHRDRAEKQNAFEQAIKTFWMAGEQEKGEEF